MQSNNSEKFVLAQSSLLVNDPFVLDEYQTDEEAFLNHTDGLMKVAGKAVEIDLVRAGGLSSTVIALIIAASRKADTASKDLTVRVARRNELAIRISGLEKLVKLVYI